MFSETQPAARMPENGPAQWLARNHPRRFRRTRDPHALAQRAEIRARHPQARGNVFIELHGTLHVSHSSVGILKRNESDLILRKGVRQPVPAQATPPLQVGRISWSRSAARAIDIECPPKHPPRHRREKPSVEPSGYRAHVNGTPRLHSAASGAFRSGSTPGSTPFGMRTTGACECSDWA